VDNFIHREIDIPLFEEKEFIFKIKSITHNGDEVVLQELNLFKEKFPDKLIIFLFGSS
jgi:hypothetical protein